MSPTRNCSSPPWVPPPRRSSRSKASRPRRGIRDCPPQAAFVPSRGPTSCRNTRNFSSIRLGKRDRQPPLLFPESAPAISRSLPHPKDLCSRRCHQPNPTRLVVQQALHDRLITQVILTSRPRTPRHASFNLIESSPWEFAPADLNAA